MSVITNRINVFFDNCGGEEMSQMLDIIQETEYMARVKLGEVIPDELALYWEVTNPRPYTMEASFVVKMRRPTGEKPKLLSISRFELVYVLEDLEAGARLSLNDCPLGQDDYKGPISDQIGDAILKSIPKR
jgi:hypothetical protein